LQRGVVQVFSPIQEGASKALSPFRDVANFFSDTFKAKSQVNKLRAQVHHLQAELAQAQYAASLNTQLSKEVRLDRSGLDAYRPVTASVIGRDASVWYETVTVDKGSADGVKVGDPVTGYGALVGQVGVVGSNFSIITLITDHTMAVAAQVADGGSGDSGVLVPKVGNPSQLVLQYLPTSAPIQTGQTVMTVGFRAGQLQDLYPPGIPIGTVSYVGNGLADNGQVQVTPDADLRHLAAVQILTAPRAGGERAQLGGG
jgi:rod shape-determining protein MreC